MCFLPIDIAQIDLCYQTLFDFVYLPLDILRNKIFIYLVPVERKFVRSPFYPCYNGANMSVFSSVVRSTSTLLLFSYLCFFTVLLSVIFYSLLHDSILHPLLLSASAFGA
jgi:hypothetical protein